MVDVMRRRVTARDTLFVPVMLSAVSCPASGREGVHYNGLVLAGTVHGQRMAQDAQCKQSFAVMPYQIVTECRRTISGHDRKGADARCKTRDAVSCYGVISRRMTSGRGVDLPVV